MNAEISIIIPVYNLSKYLEKSLDSIIKQTIFEKLEIIIINDGSTDNSREICQKYVNKYHNFILMDKENGGVSSARNLGINNAHSKYICFFDGDDTLAENCYERLLNMIENNNADIAITDFAVVHDDEIVIKKRNNLKKIYTNKEEIIKDFLSGKNIGINIFDKIYKKSIIEKVKFIEGKAIGEDMYFNYEVLKNVNTLYVDTTEIGYYYYKHQGSAMNSNFSKKYFDTLQLSEMICEDLNENKKLKDYAEAHKIHETCKFLEYMILNNAGEEYKEIFSKYLKQIHKYNINKAYKFLSKKQFCGFVLMRISPKLYIKIFKLLKIG